MRIYKSLSEYKLYFFALLFDYLRWTGYPHRRTNNNQKKV